jgi:uncharacterized membrane protein
MNPQVLEWLNLLARWVHVIAAIMWIGDSFLFMWLDSHLTPPARPREGDVQGELYMVHSGGFYEVVKRRSLAKHELPDRLYWFKWESYTTWLSGFFLLAVVYYLGGSAYLVDPAVSNLHGHAAIALSLGLLVVGWLVYDALWSSPLGRNQWVGGAVWVALLAGLAYGLTHTFGGRAAYLQFGAMLGTIMAANVFFRIIPAQKYMLAQTNAGQPVDTTLGLRAKKRSIHNHYSTLPVLFTMLSNHFPGTYGNERSWLVLVGLALFGAVLKYFMNFRGAGNKTIYAVGAAALATVLALTVKLPEAAASSAAFASAAPVPFHRAHEILQARCLSCHAATPANPAFSAPPNGIAFDDVRRLPGYADRIMARAVLTKTMPLANMTGMTDAERHELGAWIFQGAKIDGATTALLPMPTAPALVADEGQPAAEPAALTPAAEARVVYDQRCMLCHGANGAGDGPASAALNPKPRNYTEHAWQVSVSDAQLRGVIVEGGPAVGKSLLMPANPDLATKPEVVTELVKIVRGFDRP